MSRLWLVLLFAGSAASGGAAVRGKKLAGVEVITGPTFSAKPMLEVRNLRFCSCLEAESKQPCTAVKGTLISHLPNNDFTVIVKVEMFNYKPGNRHTHGTGTIEAKVVRPARGRPTPLVGVGHEWVPTNEDGSAGAPPKDIEFRYLLSFEVRTYDRARDGVKFGE